MDVERRAEVHAALGDPTRLRIVDALVLGDRSPGELAGGLGLPTNLVAHHLDVLVRAGVVRRVRSDGDGRRRYVTLEPAMAGFLGWTPAVRAGRVVFVCTANSARSLLAEALWGRASDVPAASGGTHPAPDPNPGAVAVAARAGLDLAGARPGPVPPLGAEDLVVTVCDRAHEEDVLPNGVPTLHWSIPDPVRDGDFDAALARLGARVQRLAPLVAAAGGDVPAVAKGAAP